MSPPATFKAESLQLRLFIATWRVSAPLSVIPLPMMHDSCAEIARVVKRWRSARYPNEQCLVYQLL